MRKIWWVARTEFGNSIRSKAFVVGLLAMPVMLIVMGAVQAFAMGKKDLTEKKFAIVDRSGELYAAIAEQIEKRRETGKEDQTPYLVEQFDEKSALYPVQSDPVQGTVDDQTRLLLSNRVRKDELFAFVIIEESILEEKPDSESLRYYTNSPTYRDLPTWVENTVHRELQSRRFREAGIDADKIKAMMERVSLQRMGLVERSASGIVSKGEVDDELRTFAVPMVTMLLMYVLLMTSVPTLLTSVMEEKMNKISEFLVSAVSPFQLLLGKLIGVILVGLVLSTIYLLSLSLVVFQMGIGDVVTPGMIAWFYLFLILGGLMLGSVCIAIGAACNEIRDSQSLMFPVMMITMVPLLIWMPVMEAPDGDFARFFSLIPPFTPMLMLLRMSVPPGVEAWELILGLVLTTAFSILCVKAAGKIFRIGILSQGQTPSVAKLVKWLWTKS